MHPCSSPSPKLSKHGAEIHDSSPELNERDVSTHDSDEEKSKTSTGDSYYMKEEEGKFTESQNKGKREVEANPTSEKRAKFDLNYPYLDLKLGCDEVIFEFKYESETTKTESENAHCDRDVKVKAKNYDVEDHLALKLGLPGLYSSRILSTTWTFGSRSGTKDEYGMITEEQDTPEVVNLD